MPKDTVTQQLEKVVVNSGVGRLSSQAGFEDKVLPELMKELAMITGQKPSTRAARISISGFKLRSGTVVGLTTTLRGKRMKGFLIKLIGVVMPRIRDFRGIPLKSIDQAGNLNIGIKDHLVFPEIVGELVKTNFGMQITVVPKAVKSRDEAVALYRKLGVPLQKK